MTFTELLQAADGELNQVLSEAGFQRCSEATWNRWTGKQLSAVQLQKHSVEGAFCVNLGIHFAFLPKSGTEAPMSENEVELHDCEIKLRLTEAPDKTDRWWPISRSSLVQVVDLMRIRTLSIFEMYRLDGPISEMDGSSVEKGKCSLLASLTNVRACLLLARIHEHLGNRDRSLMTAEAGLRHAGMAVGPKKALKSILRRLGS